MSIIKSFSVGEGDMFYIKHNSNNFTIIDCNLKEREDDDEDIVQELISISQTPGIITRFISTHPDQDHVSGLEFIDRKLGIENFYCVKNKAVKIIPTSDFKKYQELRDSSKAFYIEKDCSRKWMNESTPERGSSGISVLWPNVDNESYKKVLAEVAQGKSPNNTSAILMYKLVDGIKALWMGDLEKDFMLEIEKEVNWPKNIDVLFAPHHGRKSGKIPKTILEKINPKLVIIGEAPSKNLDYYDGFNKLTQNSTRDVILNCTNKLVDVHVRSETYKSPDFLRAGSPKKEFKNYHYIGSLDL